MIRVVVALVDRNDIPGNISVLKRLKNVTTKIGTEWIATTSQVKYPCYREREK
jgi:hypothetical protein